MGLALLNSERGCRASALRTPLPLSLPFPCTRRRLYEVTPRFNALLWFIEISLGLLSIAATVASVRNIIIAWSTYKIFGE